MSPRLLIVDDQDDIRLMLQILLEDQGWDTEEAPSGEHALQLGGLRDRFDALVVDYRMPGVDGLELVRELRERGFERPIILCSAYLDPEIERAAQTLGASTVSKSDQQELLETIRREVTT